MNRRIFCRTAALGLSLWLAVAVRVGDWPQWRGPNRDGVWPETGILAMELAKLVGRPADIAPSAYAYRADRKMDENAPESWILLMQHGGLPYDRPVDTNA